MFVRLLLLGLVLTASACTHAPKTIIEGVRPPGAIAVHYGINDAWHGPLPPSIVQHYAGYAGALTIRTPQLSKAALVDFLVSVLNTPTLHTVALIEAPDVNLAHDFAGLVDLDAIENGNELELPPYELTPEAYADVQAQMASTERTFGFAGDIIMGGVYALTVETKNAIVMALQRCPGCLVGVHLYDPSADDVAWLNTLPADIAITETGSPTGCGQSQWNAQAAYVSRVRAMALGITRLKYFFVYQRPTGRGCSNLDTFGVQDWGGTWKPLDVLLSEWVR